MNSNNLWLNISINEFICEYFLKSNVKNVFITSKQMSNVLRLNQIKNLSKDLINYLKINNN